MTTDVMAHRIKVRSVRPPAIDFYPFGPRRWWLVEVVGSIFPTPVALAPTLPEAHAIARLAAVGGLIDQGGQVETRTEWGYRIGPDEVWETDQGMDGSWTPYRPDLGMNHVDVYSDDQAPRAIRAELDRAGHAEKGHVIRRPIATITGRATVATVDRTGVRSSDAMTRLRALEEASARFAADVIAQSECPDVALHPLMERHHCGYQTGGR